MDKKAIKTYWDTFTGSYQMGAQKHRVFMLNLFKQKRIRNIFDVGCGTGPIYELIKTSSEWNFKYKGTDYSQAMVEISQELFPEGNFEVQDARKLTEPDNSWDCVFLLHCLDHLDDYRAAIKEATRVAKKYVCIVLWRPFVVEGTNLNSINRMHKNPDEAPWQDTHLQEYSKELLEEEFKKNRLEIDYETGGEEINDPRSCNYLFLLKKC